MLDAPWPDCTTAQAPPTLAEPQAPQVRLDRLVELRGLGLLLAPLSAEAGHLLREGLAVVRLRLGADVASGGEHVAVLAHLIERRALAETGDVGVLRRTLLPTPGVVGGGDAGDVVVAQFAVGAVHHIPELARVDEENLVGAILATTAAIPREEPETDWYLRRVEELTG